MFFDFLEYGLFSAKKLFGQARGERLLVNPPAGKDQLEQIRKFKAYNNYRSIKHQALVGQDVTVSGLENIMFQHYNFSTGDYDNLASEGLAVAGVATAGILGFKATQGGVSLLTGGN